MEKPKLKFKQIKYFYDYNIEFNLLIEKIGNNNENLLKYKDELIIKLKEAINFIISEGNSYLGLKICYDIIYNTLKDYKWAKEICIIGIKNCVFSRDYIKWAKIVKNSNFRDDIWIEKIITKAVKTASSSYHYTVCAEGIYNISKDKKRTIKMYKKAISIAEENNNIKDIKKSVIKTINEIFWESESLDRIKPDFSTNRKKYKYNKSKSNFKFNIVPINENIDEYDNAEFNNYLESFDANNTEYKWTTTNLSIAYERAKYWREYILVATKSLNSQIELKTIYKIIEISSNNAEDIFGIIYNAKFLYRGLLSNPSLTRKILKRAVKEARDPRDLEKCSAAILRYLSDAKWAEDIFELK